MSLDFSMLEGRKACVPGFEDSSGGHTTFKSGACRLRTRGPDSNVFDEITWGLHGEELPAKYDEDVWVEHVAKQLAEDLTSHDNHMLKHFVRMLFKQAKAHCDEHHQDVRERLKKKDDT